MGGSANVQRPEPQDQAAANLDLAERLITLMNFNPQDI